MNRFSGFRKCRPRCRSYPRGSSPRCRPRCRSYPRESSQRCHLTPAGSWPWGHFLGPSACAPGPLPGRCSHRLAWPGRGRPSSRLFLLKGRVPEFLKSRNAKTCFFRCLVFENLAIRKMPKTRHLKKHLYVPPPPPGRLREGRKCQNLKNRKKAKMIRCEHVKVDRTSG